MLKKLIKYRLIITQILFFTIKYRLIIAFCPDNAILRIIKTGNQPENFDNNEVILMQPKQELIRLTDRLIDKFSVNSTCLVTSMVKREVLQLHGYYVTLHLGLKIIDDHLKAHAWIGQYNNQGYKEVL